uniref:Uncharacterized protein n=1 Tax=Anguilla anguilla TaxID=7936 RepID=A0A0E9RWG8_ANGAN
MAGNWNWRGLTIGFLIAYVRTIVKTSTWKMAI